MRSTSRTKLAIVATHPIQYQVPWFRALAAHADIDLLVYFAMIPDAAQQGVGFGVPFAWDVPLLDGYRWTLLPNDRSAPSLRGFRGSSTPAISAILKRDRPDAVVISGWNALPLVQAYWACIRLGIPRLVRGESNSLRPRSLKTRLLHRIFLKSFNAYLSIGKANRDFYLGNGIRAERIFPTNYFVDNDRFRRQWEIHRRSRATWREDWRIPPEAVCFLYVGKLEQKKHLLDLLWALAQARRPTPAVHLLVVGTGELMDAALALASSLHLPVTFAGFLNQTEITRAYAAGDCLVLPSDDGETWGLVVNEAMVCGLPAVVSDRVGCGPDLIDEHVTGRTFPFGDVDALADVLVEFASDPLLLRRMGTAAQQRVAAYSVESAVEGTVAAIVSLLQPRHVGASSATGQPVRG